jgi:penicillin G amidase
MLRRLARILIVVVIVLVLVFGALTGYVIYTIRRPLPQTSGMLPLKGLKSEVRIYRDADGIPHIYASTPEDLFFAQGVVHAQDRWWQMEFNRHIGLGRISKLTGKNDSARRNDIFIRTLG